ncbi:Atrial natriuretic peptide receptor 1 [Hypsibius exemplaris]|uniref:guanylate cyclase n=1 Tax=Hypsibius exemplaris TaxID=2072580 RepID=A0A1W0W8W6_HYPEX|nr:Atrial natriuretic peptide receptor 1 [Hypsibius exemplaris]
MLWLSRLLCSLLLPFFSSSPIARGQTVTLPKKIIVGVLRIDDSKPGEPDYWLPPALKQAETALEAAKYPNQIDFELRNDYTIPDACKDATSTAAMTNVYMRVFNYARGGKTDAEGKTLPKVHAVIGPYCSDQIRPSAIAVTTNDVVQITGGADALMDSSVYTRLSRTGYARIHQYDILLKYLVPMYGWKNFAVIYVQDNPADHSRDYDMVLLLMPNEFIRKTLLIARNRGMTDGEFVFFALDQLGTQIIPSGPGLGWNSASDSENNAAAKDAYRALLVLRVKDYSGGELYEMNAQKILVESRQAVYNMNNFTMTYPAGTFYNSLVLLGQLAYDAFVSPSDDLKAYFSSKGVNPADDTQTASVLVNYMDYIFSPPYPAGPLIKCQDGIAGPFVIDTSTSDVRESYELYALATDGIYKPYIEYDGLADVFTVVDAGYKWILQRTSGTFPGNEPECGYKNDSAACLARLLAEILSGVLVPIFLGLVYAAYYYYRRRHTVGLDPKWIALMPDLKVIHPDHTAELIAEAKRVRLALLAETFSVGPSQNSLSEKLTSPNVGYWKKQAVMVRWSKKRVVIETNLPVEVREVNETSKENIAKLLGVCLVPNNIMLLYEYCSRGSIEESVNDPESKFEWPLRFSYITDIIRGLYFIHTTSFKVHGRLSSSCCFIDSRFTVKITDAGMNSFFDMNLPESWAQKRRPDYFYRQLWTAPEILRERENTIDEVCYTATREGDTFGFGIILQEIIMHGPPYCMYDDSWTDQRIYETVSRRPTPGQKAFRPIIDESLAHIDIINLCAQCWSEVAAERPTFSQIRVIMKDITKMLGMGDKLNIMEALIMQMEEHTNGLQVMIEEKEQLILDEKARADFLLYSNLPPQYGELLRAGEPIKPVFFEMATVAVVDVENFDDLTDVSSARQIADVLSNLHIYYRDSTANFDCILLESLVQRVTIASGVPTRNGILHAREVARLALTLLYQSSTFSIPHLPEGRIKIRVGIHSGPIVSGVVGTPVPRFCLFGDTLNIATRIMSIEQPLRVRMSVASRNIVEAFGSFRAFDAGDIFVKGKGRLKTYILVGEDGNHELMELKANFGADSMDLIH